MAQILCSTGALVAVPTHRDYTLLDSLTKQLHCDGYEFMIYDTWYDKVDEITAYTRDLGLNIPVAHCEKYIGENISKGTPELVKQAFEFFHIECDFARKLGAKRMVLHLWNGRTSDSCFQNNLDAYGELAKIAEDYGEDLLIENVVCTTEDPMKRWCELADRYPNVHFVFDTKMAAFHDQLDLLYSSDYAWLWKEGHIKHYHINDYGGTYKDWTKLKALPIGDGNVDFDKFFNFMYHIGYDDTFTIESIAYDWDGNLFPEMMNRQVDFFKTLNFSAPVIAGK